MSCMQKQDMVTMAQDGILKAMKGITTLEEVFRVVQKSKIIHLGEMGALACARCFFFMLR